MNFNFIAFFFDIGTINLAGLLRSSQRQDANVKEKCYKIKIHDNITAF